MDETKATPPPLLDVIAEWVQKKPGYDGVTVLSLEPEAYDWAGDTESGFHAEFSVNIRVRWQDGNEGVLAFDGTDVGSLWHHIMHSWPTA